MVVCCDSQQGVNYARNYKIVYGMAMGMATACPSYGWWANYQY